MLSFRGKVNQFFGKYKPPELTLCNSYYPEYTLCGFVPVRCKY